MRLVASLATLVLLSSITAMAADIETIKGVVSVPDAPERVLVLNPALAGSVYALDVPVLAVTASTRAATEEGFSAPWAEQARAAKTEVMPWDFAQLNFELILNYNPDLIIAGGQGRPSVLASEAYEQLSAIAPTVFVDTAITTWQGELEFLGEVFGRPEQVQDALDTYAARVAEVKQAISLPPQPTGFLLSLEAGRAPSFLPENSATPLLFAEVGFEPAAYLAEHPDFPLASTGDSASVEFEQVSTVFTSPSAVLIPWAPSSPMSEEFKSVAILQDIPAIVDGQTYDFPDYAYRFDYYGALALLDRIEEVFAK